jgi:hypothetical protein
MSRSGDKGYRLEELLRAYFLRAGFFVVRAVPFQHAGDDLTDIDLWLYASSGLKVWLNCLTLMAPTLNRLGFCL